MTGRTLTFRFEELPLVIDAGFEAAEVSGAADISYYRDGEWSIRAIALDGARPLSSEEAMAQTGRDPPPRFLRKAVALDDGDPLFLRIHHRLEHDWADRVREAVQAQLCCERASRDDDRADRRRALRRAG